MDAFARWVELMGLPEASLPLDEAALLISARANPGLDVAAELDRIEAIARQVPEPDTGALCRFLFDRMGLRGDRQTYDDPANSYLDRVLERRLGIPISLSVLLIEIGRRCGVTLEAVGMPGHFLVRDPAEPAWLIDAFDAGRRLDRLACERLFQSATGGTASLSPEMLAPTGAWATLSRILANLDRSFHQRGDRRSLLWVSELRSRIPLTALADRTQLAGRLAALGRFDTGADVLEEAASKAEIPRVQERLRADALTLRARLN